MSGGPGRRTASVLGVTIDCLDLEGLLGSVAGWIAAGERRAVCYVNAHCLNLANADDGYRALLNRADLVYTDGVGVVWAARLLGGCRLRKMTGADWIEALCALAAREGWRIFIVAGEPGVAAAAAARLAARHPGLLIAGCADGFWRERSEAETLAAITSERPQLVLVGTGTPRQEQWIARHSPEQPPAVWWAVGALFDYVAGRERRAPAWMRRLALEWLWRLLVDPLGKWRRFVLGIPLFLLRVLLARRRSRD